jgi:hypothetical protein
MDNDDVLSVTDNEKFLNAVKDIKKGIILAADDLEPGQLIAVYNIKQNPNDPAGILGQALIVKAINLPFVVAESYVSHEILTLDDRFLNFMRVTKKFAEAQKDVRNSEVPQKRKNAD